MRARFHVSQDAAFAWLQTRTWPPPKFCFSTKAESCGLVRRPQRRQDPQKDQRRRVALATLDLAEIPTGDSREARERLLRQAMLAPRAPHAGSDQFEGAHRRWSCFGTNIPGPHASDSPREPSRASAVSRALELSRNAGNWVARNVGQKRSCHGCPRRRDSAQPLSTAISDAPRHSTAVEYSKRCPLSSSGSDNPFRTSAFAERPRPWHPPCGTETLDGPVLSGTLTGSSAQLACRPSYGQGPRDVARQGHR